VGHGATRWLDDALGVPLAVVPDLVRHEASVDLARVHTLVLYTDGLVERRDEPIDDVLGRLATALGQADPAMPLELVADTVLRELLPHGARDDVALLLHRPAAS
jgi:serine phosphatase RsbU (regulator of sigma subunit)